MNALATSLQTYFTTFAHTQRDLSANTISSYRDTWRMLLKYLTATLGVPCPATRSSTAWPNTSRPRRSPVPASRPSTSPCTPCGTPPR